jgi:hypothetical protein
MKLISKCPSMPAIGDSVPRCFTFNLRPTLFLLEAVSICIFFLSMLYLTHTFSITFSKVPRRTRLVLPHLCVLCMAIDFTFVLFVLPAGLPPLFEVETDSDQRVVMVVSVGAVIPVTFAIAKATGEASVKPDTTV